ncbi:MAG: hypothetical protein R3C28_10685 [Pirellulaceae bacterium]
MSGKRKWQFSLRDLMVVLTVAAILLGIALPALQQAREVARTHPMYQQRQGDFCGVFELRVNVWKLSGSRPKLPGLVVDFNGY